MISIFSRRTIKRELCGEFSKHVTSKVKGSIQKRFHEEPVELYEDEIEWIVEEYVDFTDLTEIPADNLFPEVARLHKFDDDFKVSCD